MTVSRCRELIAAGERAKLGEFIVERFEERYFSPLNRSESKNGFAMMAIACLVIETLESFYQGLADTRRGGGQKIFQSFFERSSSLRGLGENGGWFFKDVRCGILHQAETRGGWKILRKGPLLDCQNKTINATCLMKQLQSEVQEYAIVLKSDDTVWENCCKKLQAICSNCQ